MIKNRLVSLVVAPSLAAFCGCAGTAAPGEDAESAATVEPGQVEQAVGRHIPATAWCRSTARTSASTSWCRRRGARTRRTRNGGSGSARGSE